MRPETSKLYWLGTFSNCLDTRRLRSVLVYLDALNLDLVVANSFILQADVTCDAYQTLVCF